MNKRNNTASKINSKIAAKTAAKQPAKTEEKAPKETKLTPELLALKGHVCEVVKGRKFEHGSSLDIVEVALSSYNRPYALAFVNGKTEFVDPSNLKVGKPIEAKKLALIEAEIEAAKSETMLIMGYIRREAEKAVLISYSGWFQPLWFPKSMVEKVAEIDEDNDLYEVPAWKVRDVKNGRPDSVAGLLKMQDEWAKLVEA